MSKLVERYRRRVGAANDRGMSLMELIMVIGMGAVIMSLIVSVTVSMARADGRNLIRQNRVDGLRTASLWLTEALAFATGPKTASPTDKPGPAFEFAGPQKMVFTSALPVEDGSVSGLVSRVTVVLGATCWTNETTDQEGVLRRCVQYPKVVGTGGVFCMKGAADCPESLFEEVVIARGVVDEPLFTYLLGTEAYHSLTDSAKMGEITAVELFAVVGDQPGENTGIEATVYKHFTVSGWSDL
jgi:hypothetical protein